MFICAGIQCKIAVIIISITFEETYILYRLRILVFLQCIANVHRRLHIKSHNSVSTFAHDLEGDTARHIV